MSITIDEAYDTSSSIIDLYFKNRDSCQVQKVYDDYKNWCLNNLDMCVGSDDGALMRMYDHGQDLFAAFYDLAGIYLFEADICSTDAEFISQNNRLMADMTSIGSHLVGFEEDYTVTSNHVSTKNFQEQIGEYFDDLYTTYLENYTGPEYYSYDDIVNYDYGYDSYDYGYDSYDYSFEPSFNWFDMPTWEQPQYEYPEMEMPTYEMPSYEMPAFPEMPQMPEFPKFKKVSDFMKM